jgi:hypothetical protein
VCSSDLVERPTQWIAAPSKEEGVTLSRLLDSATELNASKTATNGVSVMTGTTLNALGDDVVTREQLRNIPGQLCGAGVDWKCHERVERPNARTDRRGRAVTSELETDTARPRSVQ